ncbi:FKBP-type peptidyl-prolyl cis-trans isomerase [Zhihengliuella salsuginis]|uniref:peptidylprolyl isomerase n=1 Tax=Zhihengliuella salsuginis TaxID=578222 RepID=A0ABQ3GLB7_9MICC|nr:FKBP-type peptidyl-prolyl cis-trans isomerase [Zhihengliuella salsuginis]GHD12731.1 peptidylprolyl isomerase [Zhihengliuella salsuginis]
MRKLLPAVLVASVVALAGCGSTAEHTAGNAEPLSSVSATDSSEEATPPEVTFDTPLTATETGARVVSEGDGEEIAEDQNVFVNIAGFDTSNGEMLGHDFDQDPQPLPTTEDLETNLPVVYDVLIGTKVGSLIAFVPEQPAAPAEEGSTGAPAEPAPAAEILVMKVVKAEDIPEPAPASPTLSEDEVKELEDAGKLPTAEFDDAGVPTITIPEDTEPPEGLAVQVLKEGDGAEVAAEDEVTAHYLGVRWDDGEKFDGSYAKGEPVPFELNKVIPGWTKGLTGQKVGSTVQLTIPADLAYGEEAEAQGRPAGTLVFVVEIKDAKAAGSAE